jgi:hypothetical protein
MQDVTSIKTDRNGWLRGARWSGLFLATVLSACSSDSGAPPFAPATAAGTGAGVAGTGAAGSGVKAGSGAAGGGVAAAGSGVAGSGAAGGGAVATGPGTFTQVYGIFTDPTYNCPICHSSAGAIGGGFVVNFNSQATAYADLTSNAPLAAPIPQTAMCTTVGIPHITPSNPDKSLVYLKVSSTAMTAVCGSRMPQGYPALSADKIEVVRSWIAAGALNN